MKFPTKTILAAITTLGISASVLAHTMPKIEDARVVQPPPGANVAAAYFTISNHGHEDLILTDAEGDVAEQVELHLSFVENDVAKMEQQASIVIPSGQSLEFKHGSYHVMFMGLKQDLVAGETIDIVLNTSAGDMDVTIPIISLDEATSSHGMKHGDHGMEHGAHDMKSGMKHDDMSHDMKAESQ